MASLQELENEESHEEYFIGTFGENSDTHATWGETIIKPIVATRKRGKGPRFSKNNSLGPVASLFAQEDELKIPDNSAHSILLRFPWEVMEKIYGYLLKSRHPILVDYNWKFVAAHGYVWTEVMRVCKQLAEEASRFIMEKNIFVAKLRSTPSGWRGEIFSIEPKYLRYLRHVVLDCPRESFDLYWHDNAALSIDLLVSAGANIDVLTIYVHPHRGRGLSSTSVGMEKDPLHFADFFYSAGNFMLAIRKLKPRILNVILRKDIKEPDPADPTIKPEGQFKRLLISLDLKHFRIGNLKEGPLINEETMKLAWEKTGAKEDEIEGLKARFEEIFANHESATREGKCRELLKEEKIHDGVALRTRV